MGGCGANKDVIAFLREENRMLKARLQGSDCDW